MFLTKRWDEVLKDEYHKDYFKNLVKIIRKEYQTKEIYPKANEVFKAFKLTDYDDIKVVIFRPRSLSWRT